MLPTDMMLMEKGSGRQIRGSAEECGGIQKVCDVSTTERSRPSPREFSLSAFNN